MGEGWVSMFFHPKCLNDKMEMKMSQSVRITANLPASVANEMKNMANRDGVSMTEILRRAISREKFFEEAKNKNEKIILQESNGKMKEVVFA